jgi:uncharacterized repeat protein (TIGR02543 family)
MNTHEKVKCFFVVFFVLAILLSSASCGPTKYDLITSVKPINSGTVTPSIGTFEEGIEVKLTAKPAQGYRFDYWNGNATGNSNPINIIMDSAKNITANFKAQYTINVSTSPDKGGTVTSSQRVFDEGAQVELTVQPAPGYRFDYWSGDATGSVNTLSFIADKDKSITAHFKAIFTLIVKISPSNGGTVTPSGGTYDAGTQVNLSAQPAPGYRFDHWSGDAAGTSNPIGFIMDRARTITANFVAQYTLKTTVSPDGAGTVMPASGTYDKGTVISLIASAAEGYRFDHWSGDVTDISNNPVSITISSNISVTAHFKAQYILQILVDPRSSGNVIVDGRDFPGSGIYDDGKDLLIEAQPAPGYRFDHWSSDVSETNNSTTYHMHFESDKKIVAHFVPKYTPKEIDQLINQLGSNEETVRLHASSELSELGNILSEGQINRLLTIMRTGTQSWQTDSRRREHCTYYEHTSIKYYAANVIAKIKSQYVTLSIIDEAKKAISSSVTWIKVDDPGWI